MPVANDNEQENVVRMKCETTLNIPPDRILLRAMGNLTDVLVIGYDHEGNEYFSSSCPDGANILWLLERAKLKLITVITATPLD